MDELFICLKKKKKETAAKTLEISSAVGSRCYFLFGILRRISLYMQGPQNLKYFCEPVIDDYLSVVKMV